MKKTILVFALAATLSLMGVGVASAALGTNIPHGGYSTATDACLQCHDVHESQSDYVLLRWQTVVATCATCHGLYLQQPTATMVEEGVPWTYPWPYPNPPTDPLNKNRANKFLLSASYTAGNVEKLNWDPGYAGVEVIVPGTGSNGLQSVSGPASPYSAYHVPLTAATSHNGHRMGVYMAGIGQFKHGDGIVAGADYIPGGSSGLTAIRQAVYPMVVPATTYASTAGLYCASCHTPHGEFGQMIPLPISSKILSSKPNHVATPAVFTPGPAGSWISEGGREYCGKCHDRRVSGQPGIHTHPDSACLSCHGNWAGTSLYVNNWDFPHTSDAPKLLTLEPDGLCVQCHTNGALP